MHTPLLIISGN